MTDPKPAASDGDSPFVRALRAATQSPETFVRWRAKTIREALAHSGVGAGTLEPLQARIDALRLTALNPGSSLATLTGLMDDYLAALAASLRHWQDEIASTEHAPAAPGPRRCRSDASVPGDPLAELASLIAAIDAVRAKLPIAEERAPTDGRLGAAGKGDP